MAPASMVRLSRSIDPPGFMPFYAKSFDLAFLFGHPTLTSSQSPKGDGIPTPLQSGVSLNRTAMPGRSRFRGLIHCKLGFTLLRFSGLRLA